jgi:hypothetical protein
MLMLVVVLLLVAGARTGAVAATAFLACAKVNVVGNLQNKTLIQDRTIAARGGGQQ